MYCYGPIKPKIVDYIGDRPKDIPIRIPSFSLIISNTSMGITANSTT